MDNYITYMWQEQLREKWWRIQTTDPAVKKKLRRRAKTKLVVRSINHPAVVYRIKYSSAQIAKRSFRRLTGLNPKKDAASDVFYAQTTAILTPKDRKETL